jgi:branched-chain amino acid transport system substrate-binding protein
VFLTSGATSPRLPGQVPEWLFLACFGDNVQAAAAAEWAYNDQKARTSLVIFDDSHEYTKLLEEYFQVRFQELGGTIREVCSFTPENLEKSLTNLPQADVVFLAAQSPDDIRRAVMLVREAGLKCPIVGGDSFDAEGLWNEFEDADNIY